ncbi:hypothetical protein RZE82_05210 [Mollicutes bacterium LVI A0039]|nr:hypothetical protein RZE82_05210 [Mollicutes bacterium LVI A0039]
MKRYFEHVALAPRAFDPNLLGALNYKMLQLKEFLRQTFHYELSYTGEVYYITDHQWFEDSITHETLIYEVYWNNVGRRQINMPLYLK